jgi:predicted DNA-binding transcriptional regulator AlpA
MAKNKKTTNYTEWMQKEERLLRIADVSRRIGVGETALRSWINDGLFPAGRIVGRRLRVWKKSEIDSFIESL